MKFNAVGAMGVGVQLGVLALAREWLGMGILTATAVAVETAILHNFVWHERWTWRLESGRWLARLVRFHATTGLVSLGASLFLMQLLAGWLGMPYLLANLASISAAWLLNFAASELFVFRKD
jgi:putative flippase GtrA